MKTGYNGGMSEEAKKPKREDLTDADMPPVESLDAGADVGAFLSPKVSDALRKRALRAVFRQARFNVRDGLDDYDEDFTAFPPLAKMTAEMRRLLADKRQAENTAAKTEGEPESVSDSKTDSDSVSESDSVLDSHSDSKTDSDSDSEAESKVKPEEGLS